MTESNENVFKLSKTFVFEGESYDEIKLDLESLTGRDISTLQAERQNRGVVSLMGSFDEDLCRDLACISAGLPTEFGDALPLKDAVRLGRAAKVFLGAD